MTRRPKRPAAPHDPALEAELMALYAEVEARYAGHRCPGSSECCRFAITGREPYVTSIEIAVVKRALAARGGALSERRRALPLAPKTSRDEERTCPLLTAEQRCAVYAARPLGCRTFWCDRAERDAPVRQPLINQLVRRVQAIAERHRPGGAQGRLLRRALASGG